MSYGISKSRWRATLTKFGGRCWFCGREANTVDHAVPRSRSGGNGKGNLLPACRECNTNKDNMTVAEYRKVVRVIINRRLLALGIIPKKRVNVVFYGEGNPDPFIIIKGRARSSFL